MVYKKHKYVDWFFWRVFRLVKIELNNRNYLRNRNWKKRILFWAYSDFYWYFKAKENKRNTNKNNLFYSFLVWVLYEQCWGVWQDYLNVLIYYLNTKYY
jgi:hypothetical protein